MANESLTVQDLTSAGPPLELAAEDVRPRATSFERRWLGGVHPAYFVLAAVLLVFPLLDPGPYVISLVTQILVFSIFTMSLDLLLGYVGLPSFGHAAFLGMGAYAAAILSVRMGISNLAISLVAAIVLASIGALVLGVLALRTSGVYFLMLTLAFAQIISATAQNWTPVTGGSNGLPGVKSPDLFIPGLRVSDGVPFYLLSLAMTAICFFILFRIVHSPFGRALVGIHQNEVRMRALGYNVALYRLAAFWIAGVFAAVGGVMYAYFNHFISPTDVGFALSGSAVLMVLIGGAGTLFGATVGTTIYLLIQNGISSYTDRWQLVLGVLFVLFVMFVRGGVVGLWAHFRATKRGGAWMRGRDRSKGGRTA
jgi:branched-chain amino acid transport system permease protein